MGPTLKQALLLLCWTGCDSLVSKQWEEQQKDALMKQKARNNQHAGGEAPHLEVLMGSEDLSKPWKEEYFTQWAGHAEHS